MSYFYDTHSSDKSGISISAIEDLLSFVHHTLSFEPHNSLVLISMKKHVLGAVLRSDLPASVVRGIATPKAKAQEFRLSQQAAEILRSDVSADGSLVLMTVDFHPGDFQSIFASSWRLSQRIAAQLSQLELPVSDRLLIANQKLYYLDEFTEAMLDGAQEDQGLDLAEISTSFVDASFRFNGSVVGHRPEERRLLLPETLNLKSVVSDSLNGMPGQSARPVASDVVFDSAENFREWVYLWEAVLSGEAVLGQQVTPAELTGPLTTLLYRDALISLSCFGLYRAVSGMVSLEMLDASFAHHFGVEPNIENGFIVLESLLGKSTVGPDWKRIARLNLAIIDALPQVNDDTKIVLVTIMIWIEWVRGRSSIAASYYEQLRSAGGAGYSLAELMGRVLRGGLVCEWARREEVAWSASDRLGA